MIVPDDHTILGLRAPVLPDRDHLLLVGDEDREAMLDQGRVLASDGVAQFPDILFAKAIEIGTLLAGGEERHCDDGAETSDRKK